MHKKLVVSLFFLIPLTTHAHFTDLLLKMNPTVTYLEKKRVTIEQDGQTYPAKLSIDDTGRLLLEIKLGENNIDTYVFDDCRAQLRLLESRTLKNITIPQGLLGLLNAFNQALLETTQSGVLLDTIIVDLNTLTKLIERISNVFPPKSDDFNKLQTLKSSFENTIAHNNANIRKQKAYGATILASITAAIGTGIYFTYKKVTSKSNKEHIEGKSCRRNYNFY